MVWKGGLASHGAAVALIISIIIQLTIFPLYGIYIEVWAMFHLAIIFMVVSIIRSYLWSKYVFKYGESK